MNKTYFLRVQQMILIAEAAFVFISTDISLTAGWSLWGTKLLKEMCILSSFSPPSLSPLSLLSSFFLSSLHPSPFPQGILMVFCVKNIRSEENVQKMSLI